MKTRIIIPFIALVALFASCRTPKNITYLQDVERGISESINQNFELKIQNNDILMILVESETPQAVVVFNKQTNKQADIMAGGGYNSFQKVDPLMDGYLVKNNEIVFPVLGKIQVGGKTPNQVSKELEEKLISGGYVADPVVTVKLLNYKIYVMGEVARPGIVNVDNEKMTILEAISAAGDLTIYGLRYNVTVIREKDGKREVGNVDLTSKDIFNSPYYYLQQNDVVYVEPSNSRKRQGVRDLTVISVATSVASFFANMVSIIINLRN
ncbi:MAG: polysaccharide biosynthesis/export family protein [Bacteroidales bacterium]|nr:polysaccharide biosynthesis/export family protein [Bacteroidales bacterium]MBR5778964.1 polysaccharide biosynthesis/export family protein [Bacteroidales bacterium]